MIHPLYWYTVGMAWFAEDYGLVKCMNFFLVKTGDRTKRFALSGGNETVYSLHSARNEAKMSYRTLHKIGEE